jgi:hypothetical protein
MAEPAESVRHVAERIQQAGLSSATLIILDILSPLDMVSSQLVAAVRPFVAGSSAEPLFSQFATSTTWAELRRLLADAQ